LYWVENYNTKTIQRIGNLIPYDALLEDVPVTWREKSPPSSYGYTSFVKYEQLVLAG
jgi:hypothetical protein